MSALEHRANGRIYVRRFDHDEAARRHAEGEALADLASEYGVTRNAIYLAVTPGEKARQQVRNKAWRTGECDLCGGPAMRLVSGKRDHNPDGRVLCQGCRGREMRESVRFDEDWALAAVKCMSTDCANGERWQPPANFVRGRRYADLREGGFHSQCRKCLTRARARYRNGRKVPCTSCGAPCLPASEKGARGRDTGLCLACYQANRSNSGSRAREPEAVSPLKEKASSDAS